MRCRRPTEQPWKRRTWLAALDGIRARRGNSTISKNCVEWCSTLWSKSSKAPSKLISSTDYIKVLSPNFHVNEGCVLKPLMESWISSSNFSPPQVQILSNSKKSYDFFGWFCIATYQNTLFEQKKMVMIFLWINISWTWASDSILDFFSLVCDQIYDGIL